MDNFVAYRFIKLNHVLFKKHYLGSAFYYVLTVSKSSTKP